MKLKRVTSKFLAIIATTLVLCLAAEGRALASRNTLHFNQQTTVIETVIETKTFSPKAFLVAENPNNVISPTQAVQAAMGTAPKGKVISIRFNKRERGYVIRVKVSGGLLKVLVDGRTGRVRVLPN